MNRLIGTPAPDTDEKRGETNVLVTLFAGVWLTVGTGVIAGMVLYTALRVNRLLTAWLG